MSVKYVLAGDVGATNTRLRLTSVSPEGRREKSAESVLPSGDANSLKRQIALFADAVTSGQLMTAVIGLPGRVSADRQSCAITYLGDEYVDFADLFADIGAVQGGVLLNDLECGTIGVLNATSAQFRLLSGAHRVEGPNRENFVVGMPGSGFGIGIYRAHIGCMPSEGGTVVAMVNPADSLEVDIWKRLSRLWNADVYPNAYPSYGTLLGGGGLEHMFRAVVARECRPEVAVALETRLTAIDPRQRPAAIAGWASEGTIEANAARAHARAALQLYGRFLGRAMQSICLTALPEALYLAGKILVDNHTLLTADFIETFQSHRRHSAYLREVSVVLVTNPDVNLDGATEEAVRLCSIHP